MQCVTVFLSFAIFVPQPHIMKLAEKGRAILRQLSSTSIPLIGNPYPATLPQSFAQAHSFLGDRAERMGLNASTNRPRGIGSSPVTSTNSSQTTETRSASPISPSSLEATIGPADSLPDIYHFSSVVDSVDERHQFSFLAAPVSSTRRIRSLFVPSSPRIAKDEKFNFDHGALMSELEETSYMAWFWSIYPCVSRLFDLLCRFLAFWVSFRRLAFDLLLVLHSSICSCAACNLVPTWPGLGLYTHLLPLIAT